ncbi:MAG: DciA family protein [bacterium]
MVTPIRSILKSAARAWGIEPAARLATARTAWPRIVGPALAAASAPVALRGGRLLVGVTHATAGQEVRLRKGAIVHALACELGENAITDVVPVARQRLDLGVPRRSQIRRSARQARSSKRTRG